MGGLSLAGLVGGSALLGAITFDVTINALQDWYQVVYADAFWASRVTDSPALRDLAREEDRINALLRASSDFAERRIVIPAPPAR